MTETSVEYDCIICGHKPHQDGECNEHTTRWPPVTCDCPSYVPDV